ncbi:MAG: hypothetical protein JXB19_09465 [Bacteroidales bacterium]|nr:hypothetical protein [Bacteroidales bacterium]
MRQFIERTIELLKTHVKENLHQIDQNQIRIRELIEQRNSAEQKNNVELLFEEIMKLLSENNEFIQQQLTLISFLENNKESGVSDDETELFSDMVLELPTEESLIFYMTIQGELPFDPYHPMFTDEKFFGKLMHYYISNEAYERCSELMESRNFPCNAAKALAVEHLNSAYIDN